MDNDRSLSSLSVSHKILLWPTQHPWLALLLALILTTYFASQIPSLRKDIRHEKSFPDQDPRLEAYNSFKEDFGADDETAFCLLDMGGKNVTEAENIARIYELTEKLDQLDFVDSVRLTSLSRAVLARIIDEDTLEIQPLYEPKREKTWDSDEISTLLAGHPVFRDRLISKDEELAAFLIPIHQSDLSDAARKDFAKKIKQFFKDELKPGEKVYFEGFAMTKWDLLGLVADDFKTFFPLSLLSLVCALFLIFRRIEAVVLSLLTVIVSAIWTLGAMVLLDIPMTFISTAIPAMILVVCVGDSIYLFSRFYQFINSGLPKKEALTEAIKAVGQACFFTSVTTAAGFASLAFNPIEIIRELGIPVAIGVFVAYLTTFLILPPFISWAPAPKPGKAKGGTEFLKRPLNLLSEFVARKPGTILVFTVILALAAGASLTLLKIESKLLDDLAEDEPMMQTRDLFERRMGGACPLEILIEGERRRVLDPEVLKGQERLLGRLRSEEFQELGLLSAVGLSDFLVDAHHTLNNRVPDSKRLPDSKGALSELLLLYEMKQADPTADFIDFERQRLRVQLRVKNHTTGPFFKLVRAVEKAAKEELPGDLKVRVTGFTLMNQAVLESLVTNLFFSFSMAFLQVMILILIFFRSPKLALLSVAPNLLPLLLILAIMSLLGIPLKLGTSIVFTIVFGIAVDDTMHFVSSLYYKGDHGPEAINQTLRGTGTAMVLTSLVLSLGFSVLAASHFKANRDFGLLVAITMILALVADLVMLPALLHVLHRWKKTPELRESGV